MNAFNKERKKEKRGKEKRDKKKKERKGRKIVDERQLLFFSPFNVILK